MPPACLDFKLIYTLKAKAKARLTISRKLTKIFYLGKHINTFMLEKDITNLGHFFFALQLFQHKWALRSQLVLERPSQADISIY